MRYHPRIRPAVALGIALGFGPSSSSGVFVVGPGEPLDEISVAVDLAKDGDVVLVKSGVYGPVRIEGKGISVVADVGADVWVVGGVQLLAVPAGRSVVLDRIHSRGQQGLGFSTDGLAATLCDGSIRVQNCVLEGADGNAWVDDDKCQVFGAADAGNGAELRYAKDVAFVGCTLRGGRGSDLWPFDSHCFFVDLVTYGGAGGHGIRLDESFAAVYSCVLEGGDSGNGSYSRPAGDGVFVQSSGAVVAGSTATGGDGGDSNDSFYPAPGAEGGNGLWLWHTDTAWILDNEFQGGVQGDGYLQSGGQVSPPIGGDGTIIAWNGEAKGFAGFKVVREGQPVSIQVGGNPGETALLFFGAEPAVAVVAQARGALLLDAQAMLGPIPLGVLSGPVLTLSIPVPQLPAGVDAARVHMQAVLTGPGGPTLAPFAHLTVLDSAF